MEGLVLGAALFVVGSVGRVYARMHNNFLVSLLNTVFIGLGVVTLLVASKLHIGILPILIFYFAYFTILDWIADWLKNRNSGQSPS